MLFVSNFLGVLLLLLVFGSSLSSKDIMPVRDYPSHLEADCPSMSTFEDVVEHATWGPQSEYGCLVVSAFDLLGFSYLTFSPGEHAGAFYAGFAQGS